MMQFIKKSVALLLSLLMILSILQGCAVQNNESTESSEPETTTISTESSSTNEAAILSDNDIANSFSGADDPNLLQYVEDTVYSNLSTSLGSDDYIIESVSSAYVSQEYIDEVKYNSRENVYFGFTKSELDEGFKGTKYVFTLGDDGKTSVKEFEPYDDTYDKILLNAAIGTGVILVCVILTVVTDGAGAPAAAAIFATSAKSGAIAALSSAVIGGTTAGLVKGIETNDFDEAMKAAALEGSEGYKIGGIFGAVTGGFSKAVQVAKSIPSPRQSEINALKKFGGKEQLSFLNGEEVSYGTEGATRPDIVRTIKGKLEAIEVKNYNLKSQNSFTCLKNELKRQISDRVQHLPQGSTQRIALDVQGRNYTKSFCKSAISILQNELESIYHNIPIEVLGAI